MDLPALLTELRRRRVVRAMLAYGVVAFAALQVAEPILHALGLDQPWALRGVVIALAAGFPLAAVLSWAYDLTPSGVRRTGPAPRPAALAVAVLPFADLSPEGDQAWFCDGIAEELLGALCCVSGLRVVSRSSSFQFRGRAVDARQIGAALGATTLLEGSVRKAGDRVRVDARLVDAAAGLELWSERFDGSLADTFGVQEEIARAVTGAMRVRLSQRDESRLRQAGAGRGTKDLRAYELYLRGRHAFRQLALGGAREARRTFLEAIALDPTFARAHAGLADANVLVLGWNLDLERAGALREEALAAAAEALRLDPELAEVRLAHANVLTLLGRTEEAEADFRRAAELSPASGEAPYFHARALVAAHRPFEAAAAFEEAVRRDPDDYASLALLEGVYRQLGDRARVRETGRRALAAVDRRLAIAPEDVRALYFGAGLDLDHGDRDRAGRRAARALELGGDDFTVLYNVACFHARAGEAGRALELLDRAVGEGRGSRAWIAQDPDLQPLHGDPGFQAVLARVRA